MIEVKEMCLFVEVGRNNRQCQSILAFASHSDRVGPRLVSKIFQNFSLHRILRYMYEALNIDKKIINCTVCNLRDESFESS